MTEQRAPRVGPLDVPIGVSGAHPQASVAAQAAARPASAPDVIRESAAEPRETTLSGAGSKRCPSCSQRYPSDFRVCPRDATELEAPPEDEDALLGTVLSESYELVRVIGEGGMGRVYEARHKRLRTKKFAVKVLHADLARQPEVVSRFLREAEATSVLSHANIVGVVDVNRAPDGRPYIVAELLEGEMLADYLERKRSLSVPEAVYICRQICAALAAAHEREIVHRDIKPENVFLLGQHGRRSVKVLDFGISRVGEGSASNLTKTGMIMGTPAYMPPEQARGARVDHRADIYAVGAILYEAVTGKRPFDGPDLMATLAQVLSQEPARPCTINAALPPQLEMIIQRAMAKQPAERYRTMQELDAELAAFDTSRAEGSPIAEESPTIPLATFRASATSVDPGAAAQRARTHIVLLSAVAAGWLVAGVLDAAMSGIRWAREVTALSPTETVLTWVGTLALSIAPGIAWVRYVRHQIWPSTPRAVELVTLLRTLLIATFVSYAGATLSVRGVFAVLHDDVAAVAWPGWPIVHFALANLAGFATWALLRKRARDARTD